MAVDFFTVPSATFRVLFAFVVLRHDRRMVVHLNVTAHPTAEWTSQQVVEAFPEGSAPRFLIRDRDSIYGKYFQTRVANMGIEEVVIAPRSPRQNPYVERLIGSIRRSVSITSSFSMSNTSGEFSRHISTITTNHARTCR